MQAVGEDPNGLRQQDKAAEQRQAQVRESIEDLSADLARVVLELENTRAQVPAAEAALQRARQAEDLAVREADMVGRQLQDARDEQAVISEKVRVGQEAAEQARTSLAELARRAYRGEATASELAAVMQPARLSDQARDTALLSAAQRAQSRVFARLQEQASAGRSARLRLESVQERVAQLKAEADQRAREAAAARQEAVLQRDRLDELLASQTEQEAVMASKVTQAESEEAQIQAERDAIARELDAIAEQQRNAAAAAAAAEAAAAAAGPPQAVPAPMPAPAPAAPPADAPAAPLAGAGAGAMFGNPTATTPMYVTSEYGNRLHPILKIMRLHAGIDLRAYCGTPIYAARDGLVRWAQWRNGFGNQVMLDHGLVEGRLLATSYNHLTSWVVGGGQQVRKGQLVGYSGNTGLSGACHLHFEVYRDGTTVNPRPLLGM
ncbi:Murein DD-endopeptidase MepM and murein hydrolase activator NlpD, contain LysM domain [Cellulomonas marina]|uniref:Murein DD-endopeptidase MepM and murein hydrolase activator NlpD, contain LysM domain n=1 Tax=Cellulomonas marina TaxID=988821 RepID=A0A1I0YXU3_9CELL|nr:Murein DD-endopeptidase MepM and murein hydrolase activator NlpD, contain LysM domain [Cellulomonas marina]